MREQLLQRSKIKEAKSKKAKRGDGSLNALPTREKRATTTTTDMDKQGAVQRAT